MTTQPDFSSMTLSQIGAWHRAQTPVKTENKLPLAAKAVNKLDAVTRTLQDLNALRQANANKRKAEGYKF
jgi:hypothetical protein